MSDSNMVNEKLTNYNEYKKEALKDPEFKKEYDDLELKYTLISKLIDYQEKTGITQKELAEKMNVKQQHISRFKRGIVDPSTKFVYRLLKAMDMEIIIK